MRTSKEDPIHFVIPPFKTMLLCAALSAALPAVGFADSILTVRYTNITDGALSGATITITTGIADGSLWNTDILHNDMIRDHEGVVIAFVSGSESADGVYTYVNSGLVGFNVNIGGSGTLFSIEQDSFSNEVTLMRGGNSLTFSYAFDLPNDNGIEPGLPVLDAQLPPIASGSGSLVYNGLPSTVGQVVSLGASTVPEPSTAVLLGVGMVAVGWRRFRC